MTQQVEMLAKQGWPPELDPQNPYEGRRKEPITGSYPLTSTCAGVHISSYILCTHMRMHTHPHTRMLTHTRAHTPMPR